MKEAAVPAPAANRVLTVSNLLSLSRAFLTVPFVAVMLSETPNARFWGVAILALAALTDKLDGVLARRLNQISEWGKILDPLADKIGVAVVAIVLLYLGSLPLWFVAAVLVRDILIFCGGLFVRVKFGIVLPSNETGKWAVGIIALVLFFALIEAPPGVLDVSIFLSVVMLGASLVLYVRRFVEVVGGQQESRTPAAGL